MAYTAPQRESLRAALESAFEWTTLETGFRDHLGQRLLDIAARQAPNPQVVAAVIDWAEQRGLERALVRMVHEMWPNNADVVALMDQHREFPALLLPEERERLRSGLFAVVTTVGALRSLLQAPLPRIPPLFDAAAADDSASSLYLSLLVKRLDHFDVVEELISRALAQFPLNAVLETQVRPLLASVQGRRPRLTGASNAASDPFEACDLDGTLMIDREPLRKALRKISNGNNPRVLGIGGGARSGKTHSKYLITHIQDAWRKYDAVIVDLAEEPAVADFGPADLVRQIMRRWGRNDLVPQIPRRDPTEVEARWVIDLADFLVGEVRRAQHLLVIVLDNFGRSDVHPQTRELVTKLVRLASTERYLRLILLHYPVDVFGAQLPGLFETQNLSLLSKNDIKTFLKAYGNSHSDPPGEAALDDATNHIFKAPTPTTNEEVALRVLDFLERL